MMFGVGVITVLGFFLCVGVFGTNYSLYGNFQKIIRTSLSRLIIIMQDNLLFSRGRRGDVSFVPCRSSFLSSCDSTVAAQQ